ncbi:MAG: PKD domain-containing protein [Methanobacteriota archaeon]|nr:MAG: PKD domain-containing protein [Euryarchaeota archaeon]
MMGDLRKVLLTVIVSTIIVVNMEPLMSDPELLLESEWHVYVVDSEGIVGAGTSIEVDSNNIPHISYFDLTYEDLKYAKWIGALGNASEWLTQTVDARESVGRYASLTLDTDSYPHISYHGMGGSLGVYYARWTGFNWSIEPVDSDIYALGYTSLALDSNDTPHISYCDENTTREDLKYAKRSETGWTIEKVDYEDEVGASSSIAIDKNDDPRISYYDDSNGDLKYAEWNGTAWTYETVDSVGNVGSFTSMVIDKNDFTHISYYDRTNRDLKYARWDGSAWNIETVDSDGDVGWETSIALDSNGFPYISYHDWSNHDLKYARWDGSEWNIERVDSLGAVGRTTSIAIDDNDNPHISYYDETNGDLKYATKADLTVYMSVLADAGPDQTVYEGETVQFDGTNSSFVGRAAEKWWPKGKVPSSRVGGGSATLNGEIYHIGGGTFDSGARPSFMATKYNPVTDSWFNLSDLPSPRVSLGVAAVNNHIYAIGGNDGSGSVNTTFEFDATANAWRERAPMPVPMEDFGIAVAYGRVYVIGGYSTWIDCYPCAGVYEYDPFTDNWSVKPDMPTGRADLAAASLDNRIHAIGGDALHIVSNAVEVFDPATETWVRKANMTTARRALSVEVLGGYIYALGGREKGWDLAKRVVEMYDPSGDSWTTKPDLLDFKFDFGSGVVNDCLYAFAGYRGFREGYSDTTEENCLYSGLDFEWDFDASADSDGDGNNTNDVDSTEPTPTHVYADNGNYRVTLRVSERWGMRDTNTCLVTVLNVPPRVQLRVVLGYVNISLRIAGEKWHDVSIELYEDGVLVANASLTRYPGSPNDQMLDLTRLRPNVSRSYYAIVRYTLEDDPINGQPYGADPCWIIMASEDGNETRIHHTFNVQQEETYVWEVDLAIAGLGSSVTFEGKAYDPGADDLTFNWDFGDGSTITTSYTNTNNTYPVQVSEIIAHVFLVSGTFDVTLSVEDDDGGIGVTMITVPIL